MARSADPISVFVLSSAYESALGAVVCVPHNIQSAGLAQCCYGTVCTYLTSWYTELGVYFNLGVCIQVIYSDPADSLLQHKNLFFDMSNLTI
jgi:hypothetical protein